VLLERGHRPRIDQRAAECRPQRLVRCRLADELVEIGVLASVLDQPAQRAGAGIVGAVALRQPLDHGLGGECRQGTLFRLGRGIGVLDGRLAPEHHDLGIALAASIDAPKALHHALPGDEV
jgi:hypothetical protein